MSIDSTPTQSLWLDAHVKIPQAVLSQALEGEVVLLNLATGRYFSLDSVGSSIWQLIQQDGRLHRVLDKLTEEFDVDRQRGQTDVLKSVSLLRAHGLSAGRAPARAAPALPPRR